MKERFEQILGTDKVVSAAGDLAAYLDDYSEAERVTPSLALLPASVEDVQAIVRLAAETRTPLTARVAGTNVGGLANPAPGGVVVDLRRHEPRGVVGPG